MFIFNYINWCEIIWSAVLLFLPLALDCSLPDWLHIVCKSLIPLIWTIKQDSVDSPVLWAQLFSLPHFEFSIFKTVNTFSFPDRKDIIAVADCRIHTVETWYVAPYWPWACFDSLVLSDGSCESLWQFTVFWIIRTRRKCNFVIQQNSYYERCWWSIFCAQNWGEMLFMMSSLGV